MYMLFINTDKVKTLTKNIKTITITMSYKNKEIITRNKPGKKLIINDDN